jgi:CRISPR-associated protein Csx17
MNEIILAGCTPAPLANYLKGLGVLRLLSDIRPETCIAWGDDCLVIESRYTVQEIETFFLRHYRPTPIIAPWNGGSGFYEKDNKTALIAIQGSANPRLDLYRACLRIAEQALVDVDRRASPKDEEKLALLTKLRGLLPDAALDWFDASVLLAGNAAQYPPLLGTGGNDGRLDFTNNFMQRLTDVLNLGDGDPSEESTAWLKTALHGDSTPGLIKRAIGQFDPGQVGGPNGTVGFEADSTVNPWDYILTIEGALLFAAAVVRRSVHDPEGTLSYPFTVRAVGAGAGNLGEGDATSARGELWMPLWRQAATYPEVRSLLAEGRVALDTKPARDSLDFVRAVCRLGGYRGVDTFQRYGLLMRSGNAYLATPLARVEVTKDPKTQWVDDLERSDWLARFRRFAQGATAARRFLGLRKQLEDALFDLAESGAAPAKVQWLLGVLGDIEAAQAVSKEAQKSVPAVPLLSEAWVHAADDSTAAFRIARAVSGVQGEGEVRVPLRAQLFPIHPRSNAWMTPEYKAKHANDPICRIRLHADAKGSLTDTFVELLRHRLQIAERLDVRDALSSPDKLLRSSSEVDLDDLLAFLQGENMDVHIARLLPGLSLCRIPSDPKRAVGEGAVPAAFAILKLCVTPDATLRDLGFLCPDTHLPVPPGMLAQLASANSHHAVQMAWRRLRASGLRPLFGMKALPELKPIDSRRAAAALLLPLRFAAVGALGRGVLMAPETESA